MSATRRNDAAEVRAALDRMADTLAAQLPPHIPVERFIGTPGPWYVGAQNDMLYIVAGRAPSQGNDHPWHDAPRVAVAKVYGPRDGDCLPINAAANARLIAAAPDLLAECIKARNQFEFYEQQHRAKGTADAEAKAKTNRNMAASLTAAIARATGAA